MNLLLLNSVWQELTVAAAKDGVIADTQICAEQRQHDKNINALVVRCLGNAGLRFRDLSAVAVVTGEGSWTGIRVGLSVAKSYAYALNIPIIELTDKIDIDIAIQKFNDKDFADAFTAKPLYGGEFIVRKK